MFVYAPTQQYEVAKSMEKEKEEERKRETKHEKKASGIGKTNKKKQDKK